MKQKVKDFIDFKLLITEKILKYFFMVLAGLSALATVISIIVSWIDAFEFIRFGIDRFLNYFLLMPILSVLALAVVLVVLRIAFESILVRFLIYRETKELNEKTKGEKPEQQ